MRRMREIFPPFPSCCSDLIGLTVTVKSCLVSKRKVKGGPTSNKKTEVFLILPELLLSKLNQALFHHDSTLNASLYEYGGLIEPVTNLWTWLGALFS